MVRRRKEQFIWIPPDRTTIWSVEIDGVDVTNFILSGSFPHGLINQEMIAEIELDNSGEDFTDRFKIRNTVEFKFDFGSGSTTQFKGEIEEIKNQLPQGRFSYAIKAGHFTAQLLDVMVTKEFKGATISDIKTTLIEENLTGFTTNNIEENNTVIDIKFVNKALLDCLIELDIIANEDTYIDFDKDFHTFTKGSKNIDDDAVVWDDSLIDLRGLGEDSADVRNKINVFGAIDGVDVIHISEDADSQTTFRSKEKVITDGRITDESEAQDVGDAETTLLADTFDQGSASTLLMPNLTPGGMIYVIFPPNNVHSRFRLIKHVFNVPAENMEVFFNQERSIPQLFKDRIIKEQGQEGIINPFKMKRSFIFTFNDESKISTNSGVTFEDGVISKTTGVETGIIQSITKESDVVANEVELRVVGENITGATYFIRADSG